MDLLLHTPGGGGALSGLYVRAMARAEELYLVSAFFTDWNEKLSLNKNCKKLCIVIGKDFGITRKDACRKMIEWLPSDRKSDFRVADRIRGFHPKVLLWKEHDGKAYIVVGSSNLTLALSRLTLRQMHTLKYQLPSTGEQLHG